MRSHRQVVGAVALVMPLFGCVPDAPEPPRFSSSAESSEGMVVTGSPYATEAGVRMLEAGGNAIDAAVAAAFALAVAEPTQSGLGGRTQMLVVRADGSIHGIDGGTEVPAGYDVAKAPPGETGHAAVGTPGTVAALAKALAEHGTMPLSAVLAPSIGWARQGVELPDGEARRLRDLVADEAAGSAVARVFATDADGMLRQPALARTLRVLAEEGAGAFYHGAIAETIDRDQAANGGFVTVEDLAAYRARDSRVGRARFGGSELIGTYLPASGVTVGEIMAILDRVEPPADEASWARAVAAALVMGFEDRERAESLPPDEAIGWLTSDSLADRRAAAVARSLADGPPAETSSVDGVGAFVEPAFTTHVSVADREGNVVALTQSLGPSGGARVVTEELGFLYASTLGGYLTAGGPGYRPWSSQAPIVVVRDGRPSFVLGGAGARRIVSALVTVLARVARGEDLASAMTAPRLHPTDGRILVEAGWDVARVLEDHGYSIEERDRSYFARLNVISIGPVGMLGRAEPGWSGSSASGPR